MSYTEFPHVEEPCPHCWDDGALAIPTGSVNKDECSYCSHTNEHTGGVCVCMKCFHGLCPQHVTKHFAVTGHPLYLAVRKGDHFSPLERAALASQEAPNPLGAIPEPPIETEMFCLPCKQWHVEGVGLTVETLIGIQTALTPKKEDQLALLTSGDAKPCAHTNQLVQASNGQFGPGHPPTSESKCSSCDCNKNNWFCLVCGAVGCPRKEAGGNQHAISHFLMTGHCVVAKLGTLTATAADLYCYACDDQVSDPNLADHAATFGIDITTAKKTAKSLAEMELDAVGQFDLLKISEANKALVPIHGPGYTGIRNFGNTCYMASVLQVLFSIPEFSQRYFAEASHRISCRASPYECFGCQMEKVAESLLSGNFSRPDYVEQLNGFTPRDFKKLMAQGHREFSTAQQQDAEEYFKYLLQTISRKEKLRSGADPTTVFDFVVQEKTVCSSCHAVRRHSYLTNVLPLPVPVKPAPVPLGNDGLPTKRTQEEINAQRPVTSLRACLDTFAAESSFECRCSRCGQSAALYVTTTRLSSFPKYLAVQTRRFTYDPVTYTPKKLDVYIDVEDDLDLAALRGDTAAANEVSLDTTTTSAPRPAEASVAVDELALAQVLSLGIDVQTAEWALRNTNNNVERAVDFVFSHPEGPPSAADAAPVQPAAPVASTNGEPRYTLMGMVSHVGASATTGHYIAHIRKNGQWIMFNDEKVAVADSPPYRMAYLYFFVRK